MAPKTPVLGRALIESGLGKFDQLEFLGRGTYGETYKATRQGETYALKVIHVPNLPEYYWQREVAALKAAKHPNIVAFRTSGSFQVAGETHLYLECEFVAGGSAGARIEQGLRPTTPEQLRAFAVGLLRGVSEIQELAILHRDIKPDNVALRDAGWSQPVLLDFGLARVLEMSSHTEYPMFIGTPNYMAPEQLRGLPARRRSDLFAVGAVVYHVGTGRHPFLVPTMTTKEQLLARMATGPAPDPRPLSKAFDAALGTVVLRLLSFHAHDRLSVTRALEELGGS
jgi:eukaryotic-like serine/threonine-protein kinase